MYIDIRVGSLYLFTVVIGGQINNKQGDRDDAQEITAF